MQENTAMGASFGGEIQGNGSIAFSVNAPRGQYQIECVKPDGTLRWIDHATNVVTNGGRDDLLDQYFLSTGDYSSAFYVGLKGSTHAATSSDVMPSTSRDWTESTAYSNGSRPALTLGAVASQQVHSSSSPAAFTINQTATIYGAFITTSTEISGGSTYVLYSVADFDSPSSSGRSVVSGDTLNVRCILTASTS